MICLLYGLPTQGMMCPGLWSTLTFTFSFAEIKEFLCYVKIFVGHKFYRIPVNFLKKFGLLEPCTLGDSISKTSAMHSNSMPEAGSIHVLSVFSVIQDFSRQCDRHLQGE
jgi:hypothetical protein